MKRKSKKKIRELRESGITLHQHHIIPRHVGGSDEPENLILLTVEEHAEAHRLLYEKYGRWQDRLAWQGLAGMIRRDELIYQQLREANLQARESGKLSIIGDHMRGKEHSEEHRKKLSDKASNREKLECPICGCFTVKQMLVRWHGEGKCDVPPDPHSLRTCKHCGETKELRDFMISGRKLNGHPQYKHSCKICNHNMRVERRRRKRTNAQPNEHLHES